MIPLIKFLSLFLINTCIAFTDIPTLNLAVQYGETEALKKRH